MKQYSWKKIPNQPAGQMQGGQFFLAAVVAGGWQEGSFKPIGLGGFDFGLFVYLSGQNVRVEVSCSF